jgi:hypothetical protein
MFKFTFSVILNDYPYNQKIIFEHTLLALLYVSCLFLESICIKGKYQTIQRMHSLF